MFQLQIQNVRIVSNNISFGLESLPEDEVEQHLTISASGRGWFTAYKYANGYGKYKICRKQQLAIGKPVAKEILSLFSQFIDSNQLNYDATDIGTWRMTITDVEGKSFHFRGSLCGGVTVGDVDLTYYLCKQIPVDGLFVFNNSVMESDRD